MRHIIAKFHLFSSNGSFFTTIVPTRNKHFLHGCPLILHPKFDFIDIRRQLIMLADEMNIEFYCWIVNLP